MKQLTIKVLLETMGTVYRDILVKESDTLDLLHKSIKQYFGFTGNQMASFIVESEGWDASAEYTSIDLGEKDKIIMSKGIISDVLKEEGDQLLYIYDYLSEWKFHIEVIDVKKSSDGKKTPALLKSYGDPPKENEKNLNTDDAESILMNAILGDEFDEEEFNDDPFESGDFESLDDYEEFQ